MRELGQLAKNLVVGDDLLLNLELTKRLASAFGSKLPIGTLLNKVESLRGDIPDVEEVLPKIFWTRNEQELAALQPGNSKGGEDDEDHGNRYRPIWGKKVTQVTSILQEATWIKYISDNRRTVEGKPPTEFEIKVLRHDKDLMKVSPEDLVSDTFFEDYLENKITFREPKKTIVQIKKFWVLVDSSGSMCTDAKLMLLGAVLDRILEEVTKGNITLFVSDFLWYTINTHSVTNAAEVDTFKKQFYLYGGNGTNIGRVIKDVTLKPEYSEDMQILVINDGQDSFELPSVSVPINAISIEEDNADLRQLCASSGGQYDYIPNIR
jgi:uncharacterized protein with von Willebrand factor type A (vWA) domain